MITDEKKRKSHDRVNHLLKTYANTNFFRANMIGFTSTVKTYCILKKAFDDKDRELDYYKGFEQTFSQFYGIGRFVSPKFRADYYTCMKKFRKDNQNEYDPKSLTEQLIDEFKNEKRYQFSFVTKLLNMLNDEKYPIYDSFVATAFGFNNSNNLSEKVDFYQFITDSYRNIIAEHQDTIKNFRDIFKVDNNETSDMRILDIIVWKLGDEIQKGNIKKEELHNV